MVKVTTFRGLELQALKQMNLKEFAKLVESRARRKLVKRGLTEQEKKLLADLKNMVDPVKTHCREMVIIPEMVGRTIYVHGGRDFVRVDITLEMLGHRLGEFADTRKRVKHGAPGMGATKSSMFVPLK